MKIRVFLCMVVVLMFTVLASAQESTPLSFHPIESCRVMDTRVETIITCPPSQPFGICTHTISSPWGVLVAGDDAREAFKDRGFSSEFAFTFEDQGGKPGGCGVPIDAKAVVLNIAVSPTQTSQGHFRAWTFGISGFLFSKEEAAKVGVRPIVKGAVQVDSIPVPELPPLTSALNWPQRHCLPVPGFPSRCIDHSVSWYNNSITLPICDPETAKFGDCNEDILIKPFGSPTRVVVDVYGYYK